MAALQLLLSQLGIGGGLLFGLPLVIIGLALRGLSRRRLHRLVEARQRQRRIADITEGAVAVLGTARCTPEGRLVLEEARGGGRVWIEPSDGVAVHSGDRVLVFGIASAELEGSTGYRQDARSWSIDARGEGGLMLTGGAGLGGRIARLRLQALSGALVFSMGVLLIAACSVVSFGTG